MLKKFVADIAGKIGVKLTQVSFVDGSGVGCSDAKLIRLWCGSRVETILIYKTDMGSSEKLEGKIRKGLQRLIDGRLS